MKTVNESAISRLKKGKLTKNEVAAIILCAALVVFIALYAIIAGIKLDKNNSSDKPDVIEEIGEVAYGSSSLTYERVEEYAIQAIRVSFRNQNNESRIYDLLRIDGDFILSYNNGTDTEFVNYVPPIVDAEGGFDMTSLYAMEQNDGYGTIYMLTYLCNAIGTNYFHQRIPLPEDQTQRDNMMKIYGLDQDNAKYIYFEYENTNDAGEVIEEGSHLLLIGNQGATKHGYYFMVDNRDYIYYTQNNNFEYGLRGFEHLVKGMLVSEGLDMDTLYEPYYTTDFKLWANSMHKTEGEAILDGATVVTRGDFMQPLPIGTEKALDSGYYEKNNSVFTFDLEELKSHSDYERIKATILSKKIGEGFNLTLLTPIGDTSVGKIDFKDKENVNYSYQIKAIESIITANSEIYDAGAVVTDGALVKITYVLSIDGEAVTYTSGEGENAVVSSQIMHAVIDLSDPSAAEHFGVLVGKSVGEFGEGNELVVDVTYDKNNATPNNVALYISHIFAIYDSKGNVKTKVDEKSYVTVRYYTTVNGVKSEEKTLALDLANVNEGNSFYSIKQAIIGHGIENNIALKAYERTDYYEYIRDFSSYRIDNIQHFVTGELVSAFRFVNPSKRDPYFGGSIFENTMNNELSLYGVNGSACEAVIKVLGGIGESSTVSQGLAGETVALGLTDFNMEKYGLYAYKLYFELPRGLVDDKETSGNTMLDFYSLGKLGFTLYISEVHRDAEEPYRYVGCDMYDLVAKVPEKKLEFLNYSFTEFWATGTLMFIDVVDVTALEFDFNMTDVYGDFRFELENLSAYYNTSDGKLSEIQEPGEGRVELKGTKTLIYTSEDSMNTKLKETLQAAYGDKLTMKGDYYKQYYSASNLYNWLHNGGNPIPTGKATLDSYGDYQFLCAYEVLQLMEYQGILTKEEQAAARESEYLMKMTVSVRNSKNDTEKSYTYEFHRVDDRRIMVTLYVAGNPEAAVSEYYISTFTFKKLVSTFVGIANGAIIDQNIPYPEY